ncbi:hypothetical protein C8F04DRAFT_1267519 [Mycena alexandri]|uniref:CxC2-like cysteine cluster KDZ transposase-associated domain-containing protein n=1 Tax=Mycena alexandri TaxID=1745969 RepID=A0AAD6SHI4_9AGAR|nr:hypothetical protein C8F04DRAFT_1267519 [Mycena alexandri]
MAQSHKRKAAPPTMVVGSTVFSVTSRTSDNRRIKTHTGTLGQDVGSSSSGLGSDRFWQDDIATNIARASSDFSYQLGDASLESQLDDMVEDGIDVIAGCEINYVPKPERPLHQFYPLEDEFVAESLRREGRGAPHVYERCAGGCFGEIMQCERCVVAAHAQLPTHFLERWNGRNFERGRNWLQKLGLRIQLNHPPGSICPYRQAAPKDFVLYDLTGVHELNVDFCGCLVPGTDKPEPHRRQLMRACWWPATVIRPNTCATFQVLRLFQVLNCLGKVSAYDFLRGLERCTNHDGLDQPPDRRRPFMVIVREWREVKRMKGGHLAGGVKEIKRGELALKCRACPQPGWNMPEGWERADEFSRFLYILFLAQDANFRLSNRNVSSEAADPIIGDGLGYFCKREGDDGYKAHIAKHVKEGEVSNCSGFQAMFMANTKRVNGLRSTGVGGVTCSRHNMWPNGMGDLQVGERFCNMDFILLAALMSFTLLWLVVSYDIACQYAIHFWERMSAMPEAMKLKLAPGNVWWKVPNFHLPPHKKPCHSPYSFHWMRGAGMTHGEGVEQNWAFSNGAAASTRLMGPGSRHAMLEDVFGFHNYDRVLAMHRVLPKRLAVNIKEAIKHQAAFERFSKALEEVRPTEVAEWREWVRRWESKQHTDASESPFEVKEEVTTLRDIQLKIASEEFICTEDGVEVEREHTPGTFITMGLELEQVQRKLAVDVCALKDPSANQKLTFTKRRTALLKQIFKFRGVQRVYMPSVRALLTDEQRQMFDGNGEQLPEATRLFMPSEIPDERLRGRACAVGLAEVEAQMRAGEAEEALEDVRSGLRTRTMTNRYKLRNYTGQGMMTKGQGILRQINIKIHMAKLRYRYARAALLVLRGHGRWEERLKVLGEDDVRALNERALTAEEKAQNEHWAELGGAIIEGGIARAAGVAAGEGNHTLSWIWYTAGIAEDKNDPRLKEALRVEWCKALARTHRYKEEVQLLREEMHRTIAFGYTEAEAWDRLGLEELEGSSAEVTEGRRGYAAEHAATERVRCAALEADWAGILRKAEAFLAGNVAPEDGTVTVELLGADELDPEEEEALLEGEDEGEELPQGLQ